MYAVLSDLAKRGWVDEEPGRPKRYRARPPRECFARERARIDASLDAALPVLEEQFRERSRRFAGPLWILEGAEVVAERTAEMLRAAKRDVVLVASFPLPEDERETARAMRDAVRRGVRVRVAVPDASLPHARAFARAGALVRELYLPPRLLAIDDAQALVAFPQPRADGGFDVRAVWNPSPELMAMLGGVLATLWGETRP